MPNSVIRMQSCSIAPKHLPFQCKFCDPHTLSLIARCLPTEFWGRWEEQVDKISGENKESNFKEMTDFNKLQIRVATVPFHVKCQGMDESHSTSPHPAVAWTTFAYVQRIRDYLTKPIRHVEAEHTLWKICPKTVKADGMCGGTPKRPGLVLPDTDTFKSHSHKRASWRQVAGQLRIISNAVPINICLRPQG